ncbi:MAG: immunoglobulin domain-containing protein, partial [Rhodoglobus sp.]|nr:immunoglobulin domain-containing protein [Rhodoglobus sp.]
ATGRNHVLALLVPPALAITQPLSAQTVFATADATFRVGVTGMPRLTFVWKRNNVALSDGVRIAGATTDKLSVLATDATDAGSYTVTVSDRSGSISSAAAALTVSTAPIPANDTFAAAQVISGATGTVNGTNVAATREAGEPSHTYYQGPDLVLSTVWYSLTVPQTGAITFNTTGSNFPTVLVVYEGSSVGALSGLASGHTYVFSEGNSNATASVIARAGSVFRVMVGSQTPSRGLIQLAWQTTPAPANDDFVNAQVLTGTSGTVTGSNATATGEPGEPSHSKEGTGTTKSSIWYRWTAPQSGTVTFDTTGSNFSEQIAVYTGSSVTGLTRLAWGNSGGSNYPVRLPVPVTAGTTYVIAAASQYDNRGDLTLSWQLQTAPTIATAPTAQVASAGGAANFSVVGTGGAVTYQWYLDGRPISGATSSSLSL